MLDPQCLVDPVTIAGLPPETLITGPNGDQLFTPSTVPGTTTPLGVFKRWVLRECEAGTSCDRIYVEGHVRTTYVDIDELPIVLPQGGLSEFAGASAMPVKLRVARCGMPGAVTIDADRSIVMPGGKELEIQLLAPARDSSTPWVLVPSDFLPNLDPPFTLQFVEVRVRACVLRCCWPPAAYLTTYTNEQIIGARMRRPRRATELHITGGNAAAGFHWEDETSTFGPGGGFSINAGFVSGIIPVGAFEVLVADTAAPPARTFVWKIE